MEVYILRHGLAAEPGAGSYSSDAERPLTKKGLKKLQEIADAMAELDLEFDRVLSSPYKRARQTAEIVVRELKCAGKLEFSDTLTPHGSAKELIAYIANLKPAPKSVLLVGHEPYLSGLISLLVSGERDSSVTLKKGGLAKLSAERLEYGRCAALEWLLTPKLMKRMG